MSNQALLNARENRLFWPTWEASSGLVFFGTPHRGGNTGGLEEIAARVAKFIANDSTDNDLLMCLKPNSLFTQQSTERFRLQQDRYKILTFFETRQTNFHGFSKIVVDRYSAMLGASHEECRELNRNHRDICKFATKGAAYETVQENLRDIIVAHALKSVEQNYLSNNQPRGTDADVSRDSIYSTSPTPAPTYWSRPTTYPSMLSQETLNSPVSSSVSQNDVSPASVNVRELNARFSKAVRELDTLLIHNWIKDPIRRPNLNADHIQSALLALASKKKAKKENFRVEAVSAILEECDIDLECVDGVQKATPLIFAASCGREDIVKLLIDKGANLYAKDAKSGKTALSWAADYNFVGTTNILLKALEKTQERQEME